MQLHCTCITSLTNLVDGSLEVKLPTIWTDGKAEKRKSQKKQDQGARKGRKVAKDTVFFQCFVALQARKISKSRLAKAAGAEPFGEMRD